MNPLTLPKNPQPSLTPPQTVTKRNQIPNTAPIPTQQADKSAITHPGKPHDATPHHDPKLPDQLAHLRLSIKCRLGVRF